MGDTEQRGGITRRLPRMIGKFINPTGSRFPTDQARARARTQAISRVLCALRKSSDGQLIKISLDSGDCE